MSQPDLPEENADNLSGNDPEGQEKSNPNWDWLDKPNTVRLRVPVPRENVKEETGESSELSPDETTEETGSVENVSQDLPSENKETPEEEALNQPLEEEVPAEEDSSEEPAQEEMTPEEPGAKTPLETGGEELQPMEEDADMSQAEMTVSPEQETSLDESAVPDSSPVEESGKENGSEAIEELMGEILPLPAVGAGGEEQEELPGDAAEQPGHSEFERELLELGQTRNESLADKLSEAEVEPAADQKDGENRGRPEPLPAYYQADTVPVASRHIPAAHLKATSSGKTESPSVSTNRPSAQKNVTAVKTGRRRTDRKAEPVSPAIPAARSSRKSRRGLRMESTRRAAWDLAAILSLVINAILVGIIVLMAVQLTNLKNTLAGVLGSLYGSVVEMDQAGLETTVAIDAQLPLNFTLPISQATQFTLSDNVSIPGAYFILNGSKVPVSVTLPTGTTLPISMSMEVPVQVTVPISLQIPVNFPLNQSQLHSPLINLQNTLRPLYCILDRNAQDPNGVYICTENQVTLPPTP